MSEFALRIGIDCIVTRNLKDCTKSPVQIYVPDALLKLIEAKNNEEE